MKTSQPRIKRAANGAGGNGVASGSAGATGFTAGSRPPQCSQRESLRTATADRTPTVDWTEARRLADQSIRMGKLILDAINAQQPHRLISMKTNSELVDEIIAATAAAYEFTPAQLMTPTRTAELAWARQVSMYFCRELTNASSSDIGKKFKRDHGTVLHAVEVVQNRIDTEIRTQKFIEELRAQLRGNL